jgi:hypothetical protein
MLRRTLTGVALTIISCVAIPVALAPASAPAGASAPAAVQQCLNGGWQTLTGTSGQPFANQGRCIAFVILHPISLANVANSSITGTTSAIFPAGTGCQGTLASQVFDSTYAGTAPVGTVNLHVGGCVDATLPPPDLHYSGTFTITTNVGTLSGTAAGPVPVDLNTFDFTYDLTLRAMAGTGLFAATTGNLQLLMVVDDFIFGPPTFTFSGAVTVP